MPWVLITYNTNIHKTNNTNPPRNPGCPDYIHSEVATDFNAGFTSGVAALKHLSMQGIHF